MNAQGVAAIISSATGLIAVLIPILRKLFNMYQKAEQIESNIETLLIRTDRMMKELKEIHRWQTRRSS